MNSETWLKKSTGQLDQAGISTARLDSLVLLEDATGRDRSWLLAHPEFIMETNKLKLLDSQIARRAGHEPLAYIRGKSEFYGREFLVTSDTLQPRPETETMIDLLRKLINRRLETTENKLQIIDVGTGSGCLAITGKLDWPDADVYATEINEAALKIAKRNAKKLKADIKFYKGNLLRPLPPVAYSNSPILLCNLPYVPNGHTINQAAMQEPKVAIFGGEDGLDLYRELFSQINESDVKPQCVFTESLPFQHEELASIASKCGYLHNESQDFIQAFSL